MRKLIYADELKEAICKISGTINYNGVSVQKRDVFQAIDELPAIDAGSVIHAKWRHCSGDEWACTNCQDIIHTEGSWDNPAQKYCSECGAKMEREEDM